MNSQNEKAEIFRDLHERAAPFLLPNPRDAGSARLLAHMGFEALATTSLGVANMHGQRDLDEIIRRLQAFEAVGADVLYAPGLRTLDQVRQVTAEISKPFNMVMGFADPSITLEQLADAGVQRVSLGGGLSRIALNAMRAAAREMQAGGFTFLPDMIPIGDLREAFDAW